MLNFRRFAIFADSVGACWIAALLVGSACGQNEVGKQDFDPSNLCGQWRYIDGQRGGEPANDENMAGMVTISEKEFTLEGNGQTFVMAYTVNDQKDPIEIDFKITAGPVPEGKAIGIIKLSGDKFSLCYDPTGTQRPSKFESDASNGFHLFELAKKSLDAGQLVGKWSYKSGERAGDPIGEDRLQSIVTITDKQFVVPAGPDSDFVMSYQLDSKQNPVSIDMTIESGPAPEGKAVGIIQLANDTITLCYDSTGASRPTEFKTTADNGCFLFVLTKRPADSDQKGEPNDGEKTP